LYCEPCSDARRVACQAKWARKNPPSKAQTDGWRSKTALKITANGLALNAEQRMGIAWVEPVALAWSARIAVPFSYAASKNHIYAMNKGGHVMLRRESRAIRDGVTVAIRSAIKGMPLVNNKVWIDILVQKPDNRGDAINVVDLVCDGLKVGLGVDDRWFSIRRLDWQIVKDQPALYIGVGQEHGVEHAQACSSCGLIRPLTAFGKNARNKYGVVRNCKECCTVKKPTISEPAGGLVIEPELTTRE
jgi:hypothetical protein